MPPFAMRRLKRSNLARFLSWAVVHNFLDLLAMTLPRRPSKKTRKRVAFVKMDGVGDYIIWTASFLALADKYPSAEYERILIGNARYREFSGDESVFDQKVFVQVAKFASSPIYRLGVIRHIRDLGLDIIVNPRSTRDFLWGDSIVRCSGAAVRIGTHGIENLMSPLQKRISDRWYTELVRAPRPGEHDLSSNAVFVGGESMIGLPPQINTGTEFDRSDLDLDGKYAVLFVGAFNGGKRWPMASFARAAEVILNTYKLEIVLCGGPGEEKLAGEFGEHFGGAFISLIGKTTFLELTQVIGKARITITNDTAAGHIAVAQRCPVVVITPGNHVGRFFPYPEDMRAGGLLQLSVVHEMPCFGCGWHCIYTELGENEPKPCIAGVKVEDVLDAVAKLIK